MALARSLCMLNKGYARKNYHNMVSIDLIYIIVIFYQRM
jgi:hypothetical protein